MTPRASVGSLLTHNALDQEQFEEMRSGSLADAAGQRLRYAEEKSSGSTEFVTRDVRLGAIGAMSSTNAPAYSNTQWTP